MADDRRLDIKVGMNASELDAEIKKTRTMLGVFQSEVKKTDAEVRAYGKSTETLGNKQTALTKQIKTQERQMSLLDAAYKKSVESTGETSKQSMYLERQMNTLGAQMARSKADLSNVNNELKQLGVAAGDAGDDTNSMADALSRSNSDIASYKSELNKANSEIKLFGETQETLGNKMNALQGMYESQSQKLNILKNAYKEEVAASGQSSDAAKALKREITDLETAMNNTQSEIGQTANKMKELEAGTTPAISGFQRLEGAMTGAVMMQVADKLAELGQKMRELGMDAVQSAADIRAQEAQFDQVFSNMSDGAGGVVDKTKEAQKAVEDMGNALGIVPKRLEPGYAKLTSQLVSLGTSSDDALRLAQKAMTESADAAAFYDISLESAQERVQSFVKGNLSAAEGIGIFATANGLAAWAVKNDLIPTVEGATEASEEQVIAVEKAQKAYNKAVEKYGEGSVEARDKMLKLQEANDEVTAATGEQEQAWNDLDEATKQAIRIEYIEEMQNLGKVTGQASREMDGYENVMGNAKSTVDQFMAAVGEDALNLLIEALQKVIPFLEKMTEGWKNMDPVVKQFATALGIALVAVGAILPIIVGFVAVALMASGSVAAFIGALLPIVGVVVAVIAVIVAVIMAVRNWGDIVEWFKGVWDGFKEWIGNLWDSIKEKTVEIWTSLKEWLGNTWDSIKEKITSTWSSFKETIGNAWDGVKSKTSEVWQGIVEWLVGIWDGLKEKVSSVWESISEAISSAWESLKEKASALWDGIVNVIITILSGAIDLILIPIQAVLTVIILLWEGLKATASAIWGLIGDTVISVWENVSTFLSNIWNGIVSFLTGVWNGLVEIAKTAFTWFVDGLNVIWTAVSTAVTTAWTTITTFLTGVWNGLVEIATSVWQSIYDFIAGIVTAIADWLSTTWTTISTTISSVWNSIYTFFQGVWNSIVSFITAKANELWNTITNVFNSVKNTITNIWNGIKSFLSGIWEGIKSLAKSGAEAVSNFVSNVWEGMKNTVSNIWQGIKDKISSVWDGIKGILESISGPIEAVKGFFSGLFDSIAGVMDKITSKISEAWNKAGDILSKLNPFKAESDVNIHSDDDPYNPADDGNRPHPAGFGGIIGGAVSSIMASTKSIKSGINGTMGELNSLYTKDFAKPNIIKDEPDNPYGGRGFGDVNPTYVVQVPLIVNGREFAKATAKFTQRELDNQKNINNLINGKRSYNV